MAPKRFTFFQIVGDQALAIDFGQFEGADSEFKCYQPQAVTPQFLRILRFFAFSS